MPTFPPPRVDITSKTWPSSADMLLRRWREGGNIWGECFSAPLCHILGWPVETSLQPGAGVSAPMKQHRGLSATLVVYTL